VEEAVGQLPDQRKENQVSATKSAKR
jgi:hypothetical protein